MQLVHNGHHLGVGFQSILDLVDVVVGQASEANSVVAKRNRITLIELAS